MLKFAVLGAGNGGQAMAAYLALKGFQVNLYNRTADRIRTIKEAGGIYLSGPINGFGKLNIVTDNIKEAINGVDMIMVVTPAVAHKYLAEKMSTYLDDNQVIILNPGRTGGALEFHKILRKKKCNSNVIIAETQTFLFASRVIGLARAKIYGIKNKVAIAALPSIRTREVIDRLFSVFPQFLPVENVLKTSLDNIGAIFHPAPTLLNMAWIESTSGNFNYYQQGITPSVARVLQRVDEERMEVAYSLGVEPISACDWLRMSYGCIGRDLYNLLQNNKQYQGITAPINIDHRYVFEDVPMSLVPIESLGKMQGVKTPTIEMIINMANIVYETEFRKYGRTAESLGLAGLEKRQILNFVNKGSLADVEVFPDLRRSRYRKIDNIVYNQFIEKYQKEAE